MKKIINGALYNTETAKEIGTHDSGYSHNDFNYFTESLYRSKSGKYFLHGEGGANSKYGKWRGNSGGAGEEIRAYTPDEAREWAEEHLTADEYIAEFGEPEDDESETLNIYISAKAKRRLEQLRSESGKSISKIVEDMINS